MDKAFKLYHIIYILPLFFFGLFFTPSKLSAQKINGMSISGPQKPGYVPEMFENIKVSNANWVALIPEATLDRTTLTLASDDANDWWSETVAANIQGIQLAKQAGFKVFLKPHIVLGPIPPKATPFRAVKVANTHRDNPLKDKTRGVEWRGELAPRKEADWQTWEKNYTVYILQLAEVAERLAVDLLSIGTELKQSTWRRPAFWRQLIQKVRATYKGKLVYSANWDEYQKITFWQDLDYIGVDTYFPINRTATPSVKKTVKNWRSIQKQLRKISKSAKKKIILTEFGYRNVSYSGKRPWTHDKGPAVLNNAAQYNLYQAFFQAFWDKKWIAGGFAWQWFCVPKPLGDTSFSIQGKPALNVLQEWYIKKG